MRRDRLIQLLRRFRDGELEEEVLLRALDREPVERLGFACLDHHRALRLGHPEAIYCPGKEADELVEICRSFAARGEGFLATRASDEQLRRLAEEFPEAEVHIRGRIVYLASNEPPEVPVVGEVLILTAGTADLAVGEEALVTARALANPARLRADVGVAGLHRVLALQDELRSAAVVIVVAGMDGALASVVGGLVAVPVIAVPTSAGYGSAEAGIAPLLAMLSSCAPGIVVVNVNNGYGAACAAARFNRMRTGTPAGTEG